MTKTKTKDLVLAGLLAAVIAVLAQISLPIGPVPFTLAVLGVFLTGLLLTPGWAMAAVAVYIVIGAIGLPVFSGFSGGPAVLVGPTGGYIVGYFFMALLPSLAVKKQLPTWAITIATLLGLGCCYAVGTAWFMYLTGNSLTASLAMCVTPFLIPDFMKVAAAVALSGALRKRLAHI